MVPDKIFCWRGVFGTLFCSQKKEANIDCAEYVRKDTLLEWAKEKKAELLDDELTDVAAGINIGMDMLINKLKTL